MPNDQPSSEEKQLRDRPMLVLIFTLIGVSLLTTAFMPLIFPKNIAPQQEVAANEILDEKENIQVPFLGLMLVTALVLGVAVPITLLIGLYEGSYLTWLIVRSLGWLWVIVFVITFLSELFLFFGNQPEKAFDHPINIFYGLYFTVLYFWLDTIEARKFYQAKPKSLRSFGLELIDH